MGVNLITNDSDEYWMRHAISVAQQAVQVDEVPVGAILVLGNKLVASASNSPISNCDPSAHAEILVLRAAALAQNNYRLIDSSLYVTLEPCMMCAGAMLHARVKNLIFGAFDFKSGVAGGCFDWLMHSKHTHKIKVKGGVLESECSTLLKDYFSEKR